MTPPEPVDAAALHESWQRACRVDELLSRFDPPPHSLPLVEAILQRVRSGTQPPDPVLMGHAAGLSAPQWAASGEVVQRQIGRLMLTIAGHVDVEAYVVAETHMVISSAAAQVSLDAWRRQAETDELTRLRNAYGLQTDLEKAVGEGRTFKIGFIDLDGLKAVNTDEGHEAGDRLIRDFGGRLREVVHEHGGSAYRPHGDEFIVTLRVDDGDLNVVLDQFGATNQFAFSWGTSEWPTDDEDVQTVQRHADKAMYVMKDAHKAAAVVQSTNETGQAADETVAPDSSQGGSS
jgi:diguanylate cyclase (GGDEF)-like protein